MFIDTFVPRSVLCRESNLQMTELQEFRSNEVNKRKSQGLYIFANFERLKLNFYFLCVCHVCESEK